MEAIVIRLEAIASRSLRAFEFVNLGLEDPATRRSGKVLSSGSPRSDRAHARPPHTSSLGIRLKMLFKLIVFVGDKDIHTPKPSEVTGSSCILAASKPCNVFHPFIILQSVYSLLHDTGDR